MTQIPIRTCPSDSIASGQPFDVREGACVMWYDGPVAMWVHGPAGDLYASAINPDPELPADYVALAMGPSEIRAYQDHGICMRTLMTVPEARIFAIRRKADGALEAWRHTEPLRDRNLPEYGVTCKMLDIMGEDS